MPLDLSFKTLFKSAPPKVKNDPPRQERSQSLEEFYNIFSENPYSVLNLHAERFINHLTHNSDNGRKRLEFSEKMLRAYNKDIEKYPELETTIWFFIFFKCLIDQSNTDIQKLHQIAFNKFELAIRNEYDWIKKPMFVMCHATLFAVASKEKAFAMLEKFTNEPSKLYPNDQYFLIMILQILDKVQITSQFSAKYQNDLESSLSPKDSDLLLLSRWSNTIKNMTHLQLRVWQSELENLSDAALLTHKAWLETEASKHDTSIERLLFITSELRTITLVLQDKALMQTIPFYERAMFVKILNLKNTQLSEYNLNELLHRIFISSTTYKSFNSQPSHDMMDVFAFLTIKILILQRKYTDAKSCLDKNFFFLNDNHKIIALIALYNKHEPDLKDFMLLISLIFKLKVQAEHKFISTINLAILNKPDLDFASLDPFEKTSFLKFYLQNMLDSFLKNENILAFLLKVILHPEDFKLLQESDEFTNFIENKLSAKMADLSTAYLAGELLLNKWLESNFEIKLSPELSILIFRLMLEQDNLQLSWNRFRTLKTHTINELKHKFPDAIEQALYKFIRKIISDNHEPASKSESLNIVYLEVKDSFPEFAEIINFLRSYYAGDQLAINDYAKLRYKNICRNLLIDKPDSNSTELTAGQKQLYLILRKIEQQEKQYSEYTEKRTAKTKELRTKNNAEELKTLDAITTGFKFVILQTGTAKEIDQLIDTISEWVDEKSKFILFNSRFEDQSPIEIIMQRQDFDDYVKENLILKLIQNGAFFYPGRFKRLDSINYDYIDAKNKQNIFGIANVSANKRIPYCTDLLLLLADEALANGECNLAAEYLVQAKIHCPDITNLADKKLSDTRIKPFHVSAYFTIEEKIDLELSQITSPLSSLRSSSSLESSI